MTNLINLKIDKDELVNMLCRRISFWNNCDVLHQNLLGGYYEENADIFENMEIDIMQIVDNDIINWTGLLSSQDEEDKSKALLAFLNCNDVKTRKRDNKLSYDKLFDKYGCELNNLDKMSCDCSCECHFIIDYFSYENREALIRF